MSDLLAARTIETLCIAHSDDPEQRLDCLFKMTFIDSFMAPVRRRLAGPGYVILLIFRVLNVVSLLAVAAAMVLLLVWSVLHQGRDFFTCFVHACNMVVAMFLIVSEFRDFRKYFTRNWPLLSTRSGFTCLGIAMIYLGASTVGALDGPQWQTNQDKSCDGTGECPTNGVSSDLLLAFWRAILASGAVSFALGFVNIVLSFLLCQPSIGVSARMVRAYGATAPQHVDEVLYPKDIDSVRSVRFPSTTRTPPRAADTLPSYHPPAMRQDPPASTGLPISSPSPIGVARSSPYSKTSDGVASPELAAHPAFQPGNRF